MVSRRSEVGLAAASLALIMLVGSGVVAAEPLADTPSWAAPPADQWQPQAHRYRAVPPATPQWRELPRGVPHYRWRPLDSARGMPPSRPPWRAADLPPRPQPQPVVGAGYPAFSVPPPGLAGWRGDGPVIVAVAGYPYRFRPLAPPAAPAVAYAPSWQGPAAFAPRPGSRPLPAFAAEPRWRPVPVAWSIPPRYSQPWVQPVDLRAPDGRVAYRFRPDARFASGAAGHAPSRSSLGRFGGGTVMAQSDDGGRWVWVPDSSASVAPPTAAAIAHAVN